MITNLKNKSDSYAIFIFIQFSKKLKTNDFQHIHFDREAIAGLSVVDATSSSK
jgi:hypothetical protein